MSYGKCPNCGGDLYQVDVDHWECDNCGCDVYKDGAVVEHYDDPIRREVLCCPKCGGKMYEIGGGDYECEDCAYAEDALGEPIKSEIEDE